MNNTTLCIECRGHSIDLKAVDTDLRRTCRMAERGKDVKARLVEQQAKKATVKMEIDRHMRAEHREAVSA